MGRRRPRNPPPRPLVLVVEGHEDTRALDALALSANGFEVVAVADGAEAFTRAWQLHPDIIVTTDRPMPNYDGLQFLQDLKQDARTRYIAVVAVPKPCLPVELAEGLRQVLEGKVHAPVER